MIDARTTAVVLNPAAANGRVGARRAEIEAMIRREIGDARVLVTERAGHAVDLARGAVEAGATSILSLGGDGTHNEVLNGILKAAPPRGSTMGATPPNPRAVALGILAAGTGGDFRRMLNAGETLASCARAVARAPSTAIDAGVIRFQADDGTTAERHFLNIASFGISGLVDRIVNASSKALGGRLSFLLGTLRAMRRYRPARVRLWIDDREVGEYPIMNICVCNGRYAGGGIPFAPEARLGDGLFDVVVLKDAPLLAKVRATRDLYQGRHIGSPHVALFRGARVRAETAGDDPAWVDIDGEAPGVLPVELSVLPGAIRLFDLRADVI